MKTKLAMAITLALASISAYAADNICVLEPGARCIITVPASTGGTPPPPTPPPPTPPTPPTPPPGGGTPTLPPGCKLLDMSWANPVRLFTAAVGGFGPQDQIAVRFVTPGSGRTGSLPKFAAAEYQGSPLSRIGAISTAPCDFTPAGKNLASQSNSITLVFAVLPGTNAYYGSLQQQQVYYFNLKNDNESGGNMFIDLVNTGGPTKQAPKLAKAKPTPPPPKGGWPIVDRPKPEAKPAAKHHTAAKPAPTPAPAPATK